MRHPTIGATLRSIKKIFKKIGMSTHPSPMIPILGNPSFEPGLTDQGFKDLKQRGISRLLHFTTDNHVMTSGEIERVFEGDLDPFRRMQLNAFLRSKILRLSVVRTPSKFEQICLKGEPVRHSLSLMYSLLIELKAPQKLAFMQAWERDLGVLFSKAQENKILLFTHKASMASRYQEGGYKILTRWYRTPTVLNRIFPQVSSLCWRCQGAEGTMVHIFWECPGLKEFWKMASETINEISGVSLGENPAAFLLYDVPVPTEKYKNSLLRHLLTAAKACIPALWKSTSSPTRSQWLGRVTEIQQMENLTMMLREQEDKYRKVWTPYITYREQNP